MNMQKLGLRRMHTSALCHPNASPDAISLVSVLAVVAEGSGRAANVRFTITNHQH